MVNPRTIRTDQKPFHEYFSTQFYLPHNFVRVIITIYLFITQENPNLKYNWKYICICVENLWNYFEKGKTNYSLSYKKPVTPKFKQQFPFFEKFDGRNIYAIDSQVGVLKYLYLRTIIVLNNLISIVKHILLYFFKKYKYRDSYVYMMTIYLWYSNRD